MFQNGIAKNSGNGFGGIYSKTLKFSDINYQVAQRNEQIDMFSKYCELMNYFDPKINIQISVHNRRIDMDDFKRNMFLKYADDGMDELRDEYNKMLEDKTLQGQNSIVREKYISFSVEAESYEAAYSALSRIETDVSNQLKGLGCKVMPLSGEERLGFISSILNPSEPLRFNYDYLTGTGLGTKDFVSPYYFDFCPDGKKTYFEFGDYYGQVLAIMNYPSDLGDSLLNKLSEIPCNTTISVHTNSMDNIKALELVKTKIAYIEKEIVDRQQKLLEKNIDPDMIPAGLKRRKEEADRLLSDMQNNNQRLFRGIVLVFTSAKTIKELNENVEQLKGAARSVGCDLLPIAYEQEAGLNATLPLAKCDIGIRRTLTTAAMSIFIPFTTMELFDRGGMYYGLNALSRNLIFFDRKALKNPAAFVLGTPGSGKSFSVKREITGVLMSAPDDEVIVIDPESEYGILARNFGGEVIKISNNTKTYFNPLDITANYNSEGEDDEDKDNDPISFKTNFIFSFLDTIVKKDNSTGLTGAEETLVNRVLTNTYKKYFESPNSPMPTLVDFCNELEKVKEPQFKTERDNLLKILGLYTTGSFDLFSHHTTVDIHNRFVVFDIKDLEDNLKTLGMLVILDQIWNRITSNRILGRRTWIVVDEAHLLFDNQFSAKFLARLWKRARKYNGICTGITQNVEDLLESEIAKKMLSNSEYIMMLNQFATDRDKLGELLKINQNELSFVTNANSGQGLMYVGGAVVPFIDKFPTDTKLYQMMTTRPEEVAKRTI